MDAPPSYAEAINDDEKDVDDATSAFNKLHVNGPSYGGYGGVGSPYRPSGPGSPARPAPSAPPATSAVGVPDKGFPMPPGSVQIGALVDVRDTINHWVFGRIVDIREENGNCECFIKYFGWPETFNEWVDFSRMSPPTSKLCEVWLKMYAVIVLAKTSSGSQKVSELMMARVLELRQSVLHGIEVRVQVDLSIEYTFPSPKGRPVPTPEELSGLLWVPMTSGRIVENGSFIVNIPKPKPEPEPMSPGSLQKGCLVDVKDSIGHWVFAKIVDVREQNGAIQIYVSFFGWGDNFNEWVSMSRVASPGQMLRKVWLQVGAVVVLAKTSKGSQKISELMMARVLEIRNSMFHGVEVRVQVDPTIPYSFPTPSTRPTPSVEELSDNYWVPMTSGKICENGSFVVNIPKTGY